MARWNIKNVRLVGVSACVPKEIVRTEDFSFFNQEEAEVFNNTVGIIERRLGPSSLCASDLCKEAAEKLIAELRWEKDSIDVLVFESVTGDYKTPPTSCILQDRLGLSENCFCVDIPMGCCGCMYALNVAANMLTTGDVRRALLLIGDTAMRMGSTQDKSRVPLFGDSGTVIALEYDTTAEPILIDFHTQGSGYKALMTPHGGYRHPITQESFIQEDFGNGIIRAPKDALIDGMAVFTFAISKPARTVANLMTEFGIDKDNDIDYYLIHQANKLIVDRMVKKLKLPEDKVPYNLEQFGNTGPASIPLLMVTRLREQMQQEKPIRLLGSTFGLGLSWGTMLLTTSNVVIPELIEI